MKKLFIIFHPPPPGLPCDLSVQGVLGCLNSWLLRDYGLVDVRFRELVILVKAFVKTKNIAKANAGCISSYGYTLVVLYYLQHACQPAVLPALYSGRVVNENFKKLMGNKASNSSMLGFASTPYLDPTETTTLFFDTMAGVKAHQQGGGGGE